MREPKDKIQIKVNLSRSHCGYWSYCSYSVLYFNLVPKIKVNLELLRKKHFPIIMVIRYRAYGITNQHDNHNLLMLISAMY